MNKILLIIISLITFSFAGYAQSEHPIYIGEKAPSFEAATSQGIIYFPDDFEGKWKIIFSHPGDFTPVCTSEMLSFALMYDTFTELNCELIGLSVDSYVFHQEWIASMENLEYKGHENIEVSFPIIADVDMKVASKFNMVHPKTLSDRTVRAVIVVDPDNIIKSISYYPESVGRSIEEVKRLLVALQANYEYGVNTPAEWQPGDDIIVSVPQDKDSMDELAKSQEEGDVNCLDWYFCFKKF